MIIVERELWQLFKKKKVFSLESLKTILSIHAVANVSC